MLKPILLLVLAGLIQSTCLHHFTQEHDVFHHNEDVTPTIKSRIIDLMHPIEELYPWIHYIRNKRRRNGPKNKAFVH